MTKINLQDYDVIYISYDEPNAEENWEDLLTKIPYAKRVHNVKGSDSAHKAAANLSTKDRFITIDGDNIVDGAFVNQIVELDDSVDITKSVFSWPSLNPINGLLYGNGGIKCWPKKLVLNMKTHEHASLENIRAQIDFCWDINYVALDTSYSTTNNNITPHQAWRAGFREGVKMCLDQGLKVSNLNKLYKGNLNRLLTWMMVGADVENGLWAILGARLGCYMTQFTDWDYIQVRDFEYLNKLWDVCMADINDSNISKEIDRLGQILGNYLPVKDVLTPDQSKFFKQFDTTVSRQPNTVKILNLQND